MILGPNMSGTVGAMVFTGSGGAPSSGVFYRISGGYTSMMSGEENQGGKPNIGFDPSLSNELFGKASTIQPSSAYSLMIIKE